MTSDIVDCGFAIHGPENDITSQRCCSFPKMMVLYCPIDTPVLREKLAQNYCLWRDSHVRLLRHCLIRVCASTFLCIGTCIVWHKHIGLIDSCLPTKNTASTTNFSSMTPMLWWFCRTVGTRELVPAFNGDTLKYIASTENFYWNSWVEASEWQPCT